MTRAEYRGQRGRERQSVQYFASLRGALESIESFALSLPVIPYNIHVSTMVGYWLGGILPLSFELYSVISIESSILDYWSIIVSRVRLSY